MDIYNAASTAMRQVYQVIMFIKGIVSDIDNYDEERRDIKLKLDIQLVFLESFQQLFFDSKQDPGPAPAAHLSQRAAETALDLISKLRSVLSGYELLASKYGLVDAANESEDGI